MDHRCMKQGENKMLIHDHDVKGNGVDKETRCLHYHSEVDRIAIKFYCCNSYYLASPVMKKKDATLRRFGLGINSTKKRCYAGPAEMNLPSMNIWLATLHVHPVRVHLILAVALISICILKCRSRDF